MSTDTITPGTRWQNIHTDREDTVKEVGPCKNLKGAERVWLVDEMDLAPSNGWAPDSFMANWRRVS